MMQVSKIWTASALAALLLAGNALAARSPASAIEIPMGVPGGEKEVYDFGTLKSIGVENLDVCTKPYKPDGVTADGHSVKMLGTAFVYMGPSNGQSMLGHASERFVFCFDKLIKDSVYEYSKPDPVMMSLEKSAFEAQYGVSLSDEEMKKIADSLYVTISYNPANYYSVEQLKISRTIYEAWMDLDGETEFKMLTASAARYHEQARRIRAHEPLPEYKIFGANCTTPVQDNLEIINPAFLAHHFPALVTPGVLYRSVKRKPVKKIIIYPSQRLLRMLRLKAEGKSRLFEGFVPLSKTLHHAFPGSWMLLYDDGTSPWRKMLLSPITGGVNLVAATAETAFGAATLPVTLFKAITGITRRQHERAFEAWKKEHQIDPSVKIGDPAAKSYRPPVEKIGLGRLRRGLADVFKSLMEVATLKIRYPERTAWTDEEITFYKGLEQHSALLEFMKAEWETAPVMIQGEASDASKEPEPE